MAPSPTPATRAAPGAAPVRAGTRAGVVLARASVGTGPVERHVLSCCTNRQFNECMFSMKNYMLCMKTDTRLTWILIWIESETWTWTGGSHLWSVPVSDCWFSPSPGAVTPEQTKH